MNKKRRFIPWFFAVATSCSVLFGQSGEQTEKEPPTIETMVEKKDFMDNYAQIYANVLAKNYKLTPEQTDQVRRLFSTHDIKFQYKSAGQFEAFDRKMRKVMGKNEDPTIQDLQQVQEWSEKLYPLSKKYFKKTMIRTMKINSILTDEQKKEFKKEIDELELKSAELTGILDRWKSGDIKVEELKKHFGPEEPSEKEDLENDPDLKMYSASSYDYWELYVKTFIEAFELDKGQQTMAYSILRDMKLKADTFRKDHAGEYAEAQKQINELSNCKTSDKVDGRNVMEVLAERKKKLQDIDKPLLDMFEELKDRLMKVPTDAQRKKALELMGTTEKESKGK